LYGIPVETAEDLATVAAGGHDSGPAEEPQVPGHPGLADSQEKGDVGHPSFLDLGQALHDPEPGRVGQALEEGRQIPFDRPGDGEGKDPAVRWRGGWDCRVQIKNSFIKVTLCILPKDSRKVKV
jgi:hypothetical protein